MCKRTSLKLRVNPWLAVRRSLLDLRRDWFKGTSELYELCMRQNATSGPLCRVVATLMFMITRNDVRVENHSEFPFGLRVHWCYGISTRDVNPSRAYSNRNSCVTSMDELDCTYIYTRRCTYPLDLYIYCVGEQPRLISRYKKDNLVLLLTEHIHSKNYPWTRSIHISCIACIWSSPRPASPKVSPVRVTPGSRGFSRCKTSGKTK